MSARSQAVVVNNQLRQVIGNLEAGITEGITEVLEEVAHESRTVWAPERDGDLRDSIRVLPARYERGQLVFQGEVFAGFPRLPHVVAVHEHLSQYTPPSWIKAGIVRFIKGGPKFLEIPLMLAVSSMPRKIARNIKL
jgi:hypothetical protein